MYEFLNSSNSNEFESFVLTHENGSFMQSRLWANVKTNWISEGIISRDGAGNVRGTCLVLIKKTPLFRSALMYAPRGPVCGFSDDAAIRDIAEGLDALAEKYRAFAFICDTQILTENSPPVDLGSQTKGREIQCRFNYVLDLNGKTLSEIRAGFKSEYRNRINKALRRGVWCEELCGNDALNALGDFYELMIQTGRRDGFPIRSEEYFARFLTALNEHASLFMCYADINGKTPLSGAITVSYGGRFSYVYGASGDAHRELYPNYLMQQTMISAAIDRGCNVYDFGGIPFYYDKNRPEYGMYRFKKGFGGEIIAYAGQFTKIYRPILSRAAVMFSAVRR